MPPDLKRYERLAGKILEGLQYDIIINNSRFAAENADRSRTVQFEGVFITPAGRGVFSVRGIITPEGNLLLTAPNDEHRQDIPKGGCAAYHSVNINRVERRFKHSVMDAFQPARKIPPSSRSNTRYISSTKVSCGIASYESRLERDFYLLLRHDPSIMQFQPQPETISPENNYMNTNFWSRFTTNIITNEEWVQVNLQSKYSTPHIYPTTPTW